MDLAAFFATFEPKDWVTFVFAAVAVVVSVWTASQTWRYHPKPALVAERKGFTHNTVQPDARAEQSGPGVIFNVWNRGNGIAYDVRIKVTSPTLEKPRVTMVPMLAPANVEKVYARLRPLERVPAPEGQRGSRTRMVFATGRVDPRKVKAVITWHQSPAMWITRRKTVRFK